MWSDRACSLYLNDCKTCIINRLAMTTPHNYHRRIVAEVDRLARHVNDDAGRDHALRTARSIFAR